MISNNFTKCLFLKGSILVFTISISVQCNTEGIVPKKKISKVHLYKKAIEILKDFDIYYNYRYENIKLHSDFTGLDSSFKPMDKRSFLNLLASGKFVPIKVDSLPTYMLFDLPRTVDPLITRDIRNYAEQILFYKNLEGTKMPEFTFQDITGSTYNNASFEGKIVVVKCWYIACIACVNEITELNKLVEQNKTQHVNIVFISFAFDSKERLESFLSKRQFNYLTFPDTKNFIVDSLHVTMYPTHILLDKKGKIVTYVNNVQDLRIMLEKLKAN